MRPATVPPCATCGYPPDECTCQICCECGEWNEGEADWDNGLITLRFRCQCGHCWDDA